MRTQACANQDIDCKDFLFAQPSIKRNDNQGLLPICGACAGPQLNRLRPQGGPDLDPHSPVAQVGEGAARGV
jgi:hypothetical protein